MALQIIPVRSDLPAYDFQITLDDVILNLSFSWSERSQLWSMDVADLNQDMIVSGVPLFTEYPLLFRFKDERLPPGQWFCVDTKNEGKNPGRDDFGSRVILFYGDE